MSRKATNRPARDILHKKNSAGGKRYERKTVASYNQKYKPGPKRVKAVFRFFQLILDIMRSTRRRYGKKINSPANGLDGTGIWRPARKSRGLQKIKNKRGGIEHYSNAKPRQACCKASSPHLCGNPACHRRPAPRQNPHFPRTRGNILSRRTMLYKPRG